MFVWYGVVGNNCVKIRVPGKRLVGRLFVVVVVDKHIYFGI